MLLQMIVISTSAVSVVVDAHVMKLEVVLLKQTNIHRVAFAVTISLSSRLNLKTIRGESTPWCDHLTQYKKEEENGYMYFLLRMLWEVSRTRYLVITFNLDRQG